MHSIIGRIKSFFTKSTALTGVGAVKRRLLFYGGLVLVLAGVELALHLASGADSEHDKLEDISGKIAAYELQGNSLSLHYTLSDCNSYGMADTYGLDASQISLPAFSEESLAEEKEVYAAFLTSLQELDQTGLSEHDRFVLNIICDSLENTYESLSYPYYYEPLSPSSGEQTSILILLAEYHFESKEDVENYLELLACIPGYFEGLLAYEQKKADAGLFMSDAAAEKLITQCDTLCTEDALLQNTHFLQTTFNTRLDRLTAAGVISQNEADAFTEQNQELLLHTVSPAYTMLADGIFLLKGSGCNEEGLCHYEQGAGYYELLLSSVTGSDRTPKDILSLLTAQFAADYDSLCDTADALRACSLDLTRLSPELPFLNPEEMLADLQKRMTADFPPLSGEVDCTVSAVDDALSPYVSPAFYLIPTIDRFTDNQIYINYGDRPDSLTLYTTLAHEGYPGHLYQTVYHDMDMDENSLLPLEAMLSYGGYVEGWATYVEDLSYEYAAAVLAESCGYSEKEALLLCNFYRLDRRLQLCLYSILDVSIHYYGMTRTDAAALLNAYGITNPDAVTWIYEYIVEEPATYPKYYLGYLEICSLRDTAASLWGDSYTDLDFHTFFLDAGPAPFSLLQDLLLHNAASSSSDAGSFQ